MLDGRLELELGGVGAPKNGNIFEMLMQPVVLNKKVGSCVKGFGLLDLHGLAPVNTH